MSTPNLQIIDYAVGLPGSQHDATAFADCEDLAFGALSTEGNCLQQRSLDREREREREIMRRNA